jgi:ATP-dependent DNA ligase
MRGCPCRSASKCSRRNSHGSRPRTTEAARLLVREFDERRALVFYALDVLIYRGRSVLTVPLYFRREVLGIIFEDIKAAPIELSENIEAAPTDMIRVAKEFGFEGIVAKRKDSAYESGKRTGAWVKYKVNQGQEFVIGGYTPGNPFDALIVGYYEGERLLYAAKVRNGFVPLVRREVASRFKSLEIDTCPFANLPQKKHPVGFDQGRDEELCVVQTGVGRPDRVHGMDAGWAAEHSKFVGLRDDKEAGVVVRERGS